MKELVPRWMRAHYTERNRKSRGELFRLQAVASHMGTRCRLFGLLLCTSSWSAAGHPSSQSKDLRETLVRNALVIVTCQFYTGGTQGLLAVLEKEGICSVGTKTLHTAHILECVTNISTQQQDSGKANREMDRQCIHRCADLFKSQVRICS